MARVPTICDTTAEVEERVRDGWRSMTPAERAVAADRMSRDVIELAAAGVRLVRPDVSDADLLHELGRRRFGRALADTSYPTSTA